MNGQTMEEMIMAAKQTSMRELAVHMGYTPVQLGRYVTLQEMDSIRIYNDRTWYRWSEQRGGSQIDFLMQFGGVESVSEAVRQLLDLQGIRQEFTAQSDRQEQIRGKKEFVLPPPADNYKRMFAYLMKTRGLSYEVVSYFVKKGVLYEEGAHHNCVFVGKDPQGTPRHAACRGTAAGRRFVGDVPGNDKNYVLHVINGQSDEIKVFEAAIDCMSYMDLSGDYKSSKQVLGMTADNPLEQTLKDYPHIKKISFCLDWDRAGRETVYGNERRAGLLKKYHDMGYRVRDLSSVRDKYLEYPEMFAGKDWNELLKYKKSEEPVREVQQPDMHPVHGR